MSEAAEQSASESLVGGSSALAPMMEVAFWLLVVVMAIFAGAWLLRRFGGSAFQGSGIIRVRAAVSLGGRDRLALVQVGEKQMLLGVSPGRINTLHVFDEPVLENDPGSSGAASDSAFARKLQSVMNRERSS